MMKGISVLVKNLCNTKTWPRVWGRVGTLDNDLLLSFCPKKTKKTRDNTKSKAIGEILLESDFCSPRAHDKKVQEFSGEDVPGEVQQGGAAKLRFRLIHHSLSVEVFAILIVASQEKVKGSSEPSVYIWLDSRVALKAVFAPRTRSAFIQLCGDALEELARYKEVILVRVPGHSGVLENKKVDKLVRLISERR
ncbi:hypothetical protein NQ317_012704 [Molorchus minor]|uniref:RNase H type-1 domain-containing protein n=1 Tax=Molorchus minor TaxID=1323400 RepID=A0ABQ9JP44_9CUCU|nr:hypothetical protein NQ317_012704 [Molorchus minor]